MASKNKRLSAAAEIFQPSLDGAIHKLPMSIIIPSETQPRQNKDINIASLAKSLKEEGLLQPIVVTKTGEKYHIIAGERRYRAARMAGWAEIECRILKKSEKDTYRLAVIENLQRENLDPIEEAQAYRKLKNEFQHTDAELAQIVGKSRNYVTEILSIADIPDKDAAAATKAGINNKNLLVQYAIALKEGEGASFLKDFKAGTISTVKSAKEFNKTKKTEKGKAKKHKVAPTGKSMPAGLQVTLKSEITAAGELEVRINLGGAPVDQINQPKLISELKKAAGKIAASAYKA